MHCITNAATVARSHLWYAKCKVVLTQLILLQGSQFSVNEVEVVTATVDLDEVVRYRGKRWPLRVHLQFRTKPSEYNL